MFEWGGGMGGFVGLGVGRECVYKYVGVFEMGTCKRWEWMWRSKSILHEDQTKHN